MAKRRQVQIGITGDAGDAERAFRGVGIAADKAADKVEAAGDDAGEGFKAGVDGPVGRLSGSGPGSIASRIASMGTAVAAAAAAVGLSAGVALGAAVVDQFTRILDSERTGDLIGARLGLDESSQEYLGRIAGEAYLRGYGESTSENIELGGLITSLSSLTIDEITSEDIGITSSVAELLGAAPEELLQASRVAAASGVQYREFLDMVAAGVPRGFNRTGDALEAFTEFGSKLADFGLDPEAFITLESAFSRAGVRDAGRSVDVLTEFFNLTSAGSDATKDAFAAVGLSWSQSMRRIDAGDAIGVIDDIFDRIDQIDPSKTPDILANIFGGPGEDVGLGILASVGDAVDGATAGLGDFAGAAAEVDQRMWDNLSTRIEIVKRRLFALAEPLAEKLIPLAERFVGFGERLLDAWGEDGFAGVLEIVGEKVDDLSGWFEALDPKLQAVIVGFAVLAGVLLIAGLIAAIGAALSLLLSPVVLVAAAIAGLSAGLFYAYENWGWFRTGVDAVWAFLSETVWPFLQEFGGWLAGELVDLFETLTEAWDTVWAGVEKAWADWGAPTFELVQTGVEVLGDVWSAVSAAMDGDWSAAWDSIEEAASTAWAGLVSWLGQIGPRTATAVGDVADTLWDKGWDLMFGLREGLWSFYSGTLFPWFVGLPGRLVGAVGSLQLKLWNAGWDLMKGLRDGIVSGFDNMVTGALAKVTDLIPDWKGPEERDRRLLQPAGLAIMHGLTVGLESGFSGEVAPSLGSMTSALRSMTSAIPAAMPAAGGDGGVGGETRVLIESDGSPVGDLIAELMKDYARVTAGGDVQLAFGWSR